ncbi:glycosyltransferase family 4 protein [Sulfurimonas sp. C5]|uniref:glycosyltransferase family 4 protein n=1 Tax=Sulfurimonas sp. C5 TaxID=3036947 RepID=UPI0024537580|nr:glycosyltransferase family 4 protein [Sulfurimonas sp. C5]MDH4945458.1 glycosyltransferase family 4 protein [Sulfurimonas sp. C5]
MNKKILEVCLSPDLGGLELYAYSCYKNFSSNTEVFMAISKGSKLDQYFDDPNKVYIKRSKFPLASAWRLAKYIDKQTVDVVHFHWTKDILTVVLAKILSKRKPTVIQSRHMRMTRFKNDLYHRWLYKNIEMMHAVTNEVHKQLVKFIPEDIVPKVTTIYPGVKRKSILDISSLEQMYKSTDTFTVGIIGRIEEAKGQIVAIEAISKLKELNIQLIIVGAAMDEDYLVRLKNIVKNLSIENKVIFTGFTKEVDKYMQLCDISIMATENETFGLVVIESMANGTPVIAKNMGGPLEIIENNVDGLFYDGSPSDLASKIKLLYDDKNLLQKLCENGMKKVENQFDFENQLNKLYKVINES